MKSTLAAFDDFKNYNKFMLSDSLNVQPNSDIKLLKNHLTHVLIIVDI